MTSDVPLTTGRVEWEGPTTKTSVGLRDWRQHPAMTPSTVGSMTIAVQTFVERLP
jgi:hypothetical protein